MTTLSIGMIVKDEEKRLRKTLEALQPLREAVDCQLIIADTGSEDDTIAIAKEFADVFLQIPWENDFAKARNATLEKAKGTWFFYLDADEVLNDAEELIKFFHKSDAKKYQCLSILIRNRVSEKRDLWQDFTSERIFQRRKGEWFVGAIHETYPRWLPVYELKQTHMIHYGYDNDDKEFMRKKGDRNLSILEKLLENEDQMNDIGAAKLWLDYADSLMLHHERVDEAKDAAYQGIELIKLLPENDDTRIVMLARAYSQIARIMTELDQHQLCIDMAEEYFDVQPIRGIWDMDIYCFAGWAQMNLKNDYEASQYIEHYLKLQQQEKDPAVTRLLIFATEDFKDQSLLFLTQIYQRLHEFDKMWQSVERIEKTTVSGVNIQPYKWQMALDNNSAQRIPKLYQKLDQETREMILGNLADAICKKDGARQRDIAIGLSQIVDQDSAFLPLLALAINDHDEMIACLEKMDTRQFEAKQGGIIRQCLKLLVPMKYWLPHLKGGNLEDYISNCDLHYNDWMHWGAVYFDDLPPEELSLMEVWLGQSLLRYGLFKSTLDNGMIMLIWPIAISYAISYMQRIYQPQILEKEQRAILSQQEQFMWIANEFEEQQQLGNYADCLALLRQGLAIYPEANRVARLKLEEIEQIIDPAAAEMKQLAKTVKRQIRELIEQDNLAAARVLLDELTAIMPNDLEAVELLAQTENNDETVLWH